MLVAIDRWLTGGTGFAQVQPNPYWLPVLAMALAYGTGPGVLAAALAAGGPIDVFAAYDRSRRTAALRATRQAAFNMRMGAPASGVRLRTRNAAVRVLGLPGLRGLLARSFTMQWL